MKEKIAKLFRFDTYGTDFKTELVAGITTFMSVSYILAVNPSIMSAAGMDKGAVFTATALASAIGTLLMALLTNYPFALAPGMGLNAYFAYTVVLGMGYSWQMALAAVFLEGLIFIVLSLTNVREAIFNAIPVTLKLAISSGIGLFICLIGFQNAHIVVKNESTLVALYNWTQASSVTEGLTVALAMIGIIVTAFLMIKNVKGAVLICILVSWGLGIICQLAGLYVPIPDAGFYSLIPDFSAGVSIAPISPTFMQMDFSRALSLDFLVVIFAFLFVDVFDTLGTLTGCAIKAGFLDENGKMPRIKGALLADSIATSVGAALGVSTTTTYVESSLGIAEGGRSGLAGIVIAIMFLASILLSPIFLAIPSYATAPALVIVGFLMMQNVVDIDFSDLTEGIPAFLCMATMAFAYSISEGISAGFISYTILNLLAGKRDNLSVLMYILTALFILKYVFL